MDTIKARAALIHHNDAQAHQTATKLQKAGFQVEKVSPYGVSFSGSTDLFESVFHTEICENLNTHKFKHIPEVPIDMIDDIESIYLPSAVQYFP